MDLGARGFMQNSFPLDGQGFDPARIGLGGHTDVDIGAVLQHVENG